MPDPLSVTAAIALAGKCLNGVTKAVQAGREIESAMGHISRWFECVSDINAAERRNKNPSIFKKITNNKSIEAEAFQIWKTKQLVAKQRATLRTTVIYTYGKDVWQELLDIEKSVREERKRLIHRRAEFKQKVADTLVICIGGCLIIGILVGFAYVLSLGG